MTERNMKRIAIHAVCRTYLCIAIRAHVVPQQFEYIIFIPKFIYGLMRQRPVLRSDMKERGHFVGLTPMRIAVK